MNIKRVFTFLILFLLTTVFTTTRPSSALTSVDGPSAFGEGEYTFLNVFRFPVRTEHWAFSFSATEKKNGKGKGRGQFDNLTTQTRVDVKFDCVNIQGSEAIISGRVQHSDNPDFPKGVRVLFAATDGSLVPVPFFRDRITPIFSSDIFGDFAADCSVSPLTILLLDSGDIVIEP